MSHLCDVRTVQSQIEKTELQNYRPFDLLVLSRTGHTRLLSWDGFELSITNNPAMPLTSSSFNTEQVTQDRVQQLTQMMKTGSPEPGELINYHASHLPQRGPFSVCMHRDNAQTVSFSHIEVQAEDINFHYYDGPPCSASAGHTTRLKVQHHAQHDVA